MIKWIAPRIIYVSREGWRADLSLPQLGVIVDPVLRTGRRTHHSVIIDPDATPNRWTHLPEVFGKMQQLQTIRPDLGLDVPYTLVAFAMEVGFTYQDKRVDIVLCEGRGLMRSAAHTAGRNDQGVYFNISDIAICWEGNFEIPVLWLQTPEYRESASHMWGWVAFTQGLTNLQTGPSLGHRDDAQTLCPGGYLYAELQHHDPVNPPNKEEQDPIVLAGEDTSMALIIKTRTDHKSYLWTGNTRRHMQSRTERELTATLLHIIPTPTIVSEELLNRIPEVSA